MTATSSPAEPPESTLAEVVARELYADRLRWETDAEPTVHRVTTHDRALAKKILAAILAATPTAAHVEAD